MTDQPALVRCACADAGTPGLLTDQTGRSRPCPSCTGPHAPRGWCLQGNGPVLTLDFRASQADRYPEPIR